jgi:hypothetical protein
MPLRRNRCFRSMVVSMLLAFLQPSKHSNMIRRISSSSPGRSNSPPNPTNSYPASLQPFHIPHIFPLFARRNRPPQRRLDVSPDQSISRISISCYPALSQICDKAFGQADGDVKTLAFVRGLEAFGQVASAGGDWNEVRVEVEMFLSEVKGSGEVF